VAVFEDARSGSVGFRECDVAGEAKVRGRYGAIDVNMQIRSACVGSSGSCLGIIRLAGKYSAQRVEAAAERALLTGACRYKSIESILKNSLDRLPPPPPLPPASSPPPLHDNIRGSEYFE
jgi:hypothetical protein